MSRRTLLLGAAGIVAILFLWIGLSQPIPEPDSSAIPSQPDRHSTAPETQTAMPAETEPGFPPPPERAIVAPPDSLNQSDKTVQLALVDMAADLQQWMTAEEQVRKWVLTVDNFADGELIGKYRPWGYPMAKFAVEETPAGLRMSEANFRRTSELLDVALALDPELLARYYRAWRPLLEKAYGELGKGGDFDSRLHAAITKALNVKPLTREPLLERVKVMYTYKDPALENASGIEKMMWRMGPQNMKRVQQYLRRLEASL